MRLRTGYLVVLFLFQVITLGASNTGRSFDALAGQRKGKAATAQPGKGDWPMFGRDLPGSHYNPHETRLTPATVSHLKPKWVFETDADVSSEPTVVNGVVYFGSWDGKTYAVDANTGKETWHFDTNGSGCRSAAAYGDGTLFFNDIAGRLYAVDAKTGELKWKIRIDEHPRVVGTSSPIYHDGVIYQGISSHEEGATLQNPKYECCTFRGGVAAFDAKDGKLIWRFYTIPGEPKPIGESKRGIPMWGPAGGAVWSTVTIHPAQNRLYVTVGNQYTGPPVKYPNAIVALELKTGKVVWSYQATPGDLWTFDCRNQPDCSDLDVDFGATPITFKGPGGKTLVGAGQKSGWFYALDPKDGKVVWKTEVGPGGKLGGIEFGNATDGERVYAALSNFPRQGSITAMDGATGKILWETKSPDNGSNFGPVAVTGTGTNRLVFAGSNKNFIRAYDAASGKILWEFDTGGAVGGGPSIVDGVVYVGSGYTFLRVGKGNNKLYAFSLDGK